MRATEVVQRQGATLYGSGVSRRGTIRQTGLRVTGGFVNEDAAFATLLTLDDATASVRVEANRLLYSTLELIVNPSSPAVDWMDSSSTASPLDGKRADKDPRNAIFDFNAALAAARRRSSTLNESGVKALFIKALDQAFYQPLVSRLLLHDQRDATDFPYILGKSEDV
ncbi:hypothetical protein CYMTET_56695 [Cymbomonas tetramitiformis]|uniref:Uncharacterized protein n=1 Tax=Cymbomonas tetramitiformis TaxID=36881 RepID=A0AAE0BBP2_9CHLO|nr:hypothetical protein CYMTET_56695 [Cymbomonas tetramitiformis]